MKQHPIPTQNTNTSSSTPSTSTSARARGGQPEGLPVRMITRQQLAARVGLSVRMIDELTHTGVLPYFKIGKAVRYDLAEAEAAFRARYYVAAHPAQGRAGCPQPAASEDGGTVAATQRQEGLGCGVCPGSVECQGTPGGGLGTSLPPLNPPASGSHASTGCVVASGNTTNYHEKAAPAASSSSFTTLTPAA